jgi:hypothetical protein
LFFVKSPDLELDPDQELEKCWLLPNLYNIDQVQTGYYDPSAPQFAYLPQQPGGFTDHPPPKYEDINPKKND